MTAIMNPSFSLSSSQDPISAASQEPYFIPEIASATASNYENAFHSPQLQQDQISGSASPTPSSSRTSPSAEMPPPQTPAYQQQQLPQRNTNPLIFPEADALLCPSMDGFLVASHQQDGTASWTPVSWPSFLQFVCNETNVGHLSPKHPMRLFAKIVRDNSLQSRLSPALHQPTLGLLPHQMPGTPMGRPTLQPNYSYSTPQPPLQRSTSAQHAIPRSPRYNPIAGRPQSARAVLHSGQLQTQQLSSPMTPYTPRFGQNAQSVVKRKPVELNQQDDAYIWNIHDKRLYIFGSKESENSMGKPENVMIVFPAGTTREAKEKDGSRALPAWTSSWPNSNTWLKEQVCGKGCSHANGFGQKRPVLIREHHRRCPHVAANHPLKLLCTLELEAHSKSQWAEKQLKRKRADLSVSTTNNNTMSSPLLAPNTAMQWTPDINLSSLPQQTPSYTPIQTPLFTPAQTPSYSYQQPSNNQDYQQSPNNQDIPVSFDTAPTNAASDLRINTNVQQSPFTNPSSGTYDDLDSGSAFTLPSAVSMSYGSPSSSSSPLMRDTATTSWDSNSVLSNEEFNDILAMFGKDDVPGQRTT